ncbi:MAG: 30S ribosomal protein S4 [Anaerococcus vaginalis]|uniref:30S ribosomal protein S4 n=1 Tax=Anaerococcus vaginalis TaxID=33037 RepID=UPI00288B7A9B|nr:30S ribosomal protein S4 [Anaerococcus vaginalis]MDU4377867.1 30S ribosomal protein S4 [Anaerococcus vaginalis]MDU5342104.1 30S ribosomal protein S4 [Anaerococcus vaginalis]MDU5824501.1 30S ribosomal protein S4 [Anaerococcus vaginalis]
MAVSRDPIFKRCRSLGISPAYLGYSGESKRSNSNQRRKLSEYGMQQREKQKAKFIYGVSEKQFRSYYEKASKMQGQTGENLIILCERRLDNIAFRSGLARTRREARQIVTHGHLLVNGKSVDIPSILVNEGDVIEVKEKSRSSQLFKAIKETNQSFGVVSWLDSDLENLKVKVTNFPTREDIDIPVEERMIVEFYSK